MRLTDALRLRPGMSVAFTGAGGKSSGLETLARESSGRYPIVLTTTTRLGIAQLSLAHEHFRVASPDDIRRLPIGGQRGILVTAGEDVAEGKLLGLSATELAQVAALAREAEALLAIEADGARGRMVKAPAEHEPRVPDWVDVVVPVAGLQAIGAPLAAPIAHRPERIARVLSIREGDSITAQMLGTLISSQDGGLKGVPGNAEVRVLLTGADTVSAETVEEVEAVLAKSERVRAVLSGELSSADPIHRVHGRVAGIVLAGGAGERFGGPKQVALWQGKPLVAHVLEAARDGGLSPIVVVLGAQADAVRAAIGGADVRFVENSAWEDGQSTSVDAGLAAVEGTVEAAVFLLADMPRVSPKTIRRLIDVHRKSLSSIVAPVGGGRRGNPVLFDRRVFADLHNLEGDEGGRSLLDRLAWQAVEADPAEFFEVDHPDDLESLERGR